MVTRTRVMRDRLAFHLYSSETPLSDSPPSAVAFAYPSAFSLPGMPWRTGTQRWLSRCSCQQPSADLDGYHGEALPWTDAVRPNPLDGSGGIHKDGVLLAVVLPLVHDAKRLVNGIRPRIEDLLVGAEVGAASGPPARSLPDTCRSHFPLSILEPPVQTVFPLPHELAARLATSLLSTFAWPGKEGRAHHSRASTVSPVRRPQP